MRKKFIPAILLMLLNLVSTPFSAAGQKPVERFVATQWGMKEGLPQSSVNCVIQSREGYLWISTFGGLVRFNGESFTTFNRSNTPGLRSDRMLLLYEDHAGAIWCGTEDGLSRFYRGAFTSFHDFDSANNYAPMLITEDDQNRLWVSVDGKPFRFSGEKFVPVTIARDPGLISSAVNNPGGIWMAHNRELLRTMGDSIVLIKSFSRDYLDQLVHAVEDPKDRDWIWLASTGSGVIRFHVPTGAMHRFTMADGLPSNYFRRLFVDNDGRVMTAGFNGISRWNGKRFDPIVTVNSDEDKQFNEVMQDSEGNYWMGTPAHGLYRLRSSVISMLDERSGLAEGKMLSLAARKNGTMLFGTNCGGIYEWDGDTVTHSTINSTLVNLCTWSILEDSRERIWVGSKVLMRYDHPKAKGIVFDSSSGFKGIDVYAIAEDSRGTLWFGCLNGLFRYDGRRFTRYSSPQGLTHHEVRTIVEDRSGKIWIGTTQGLFVMENDSIVPLPIFLNGDPARPALTSYVRAIHHDESGTTWIGTYGGGILRYREGIFTAMTTNDGLADNIVSHIVESPRGYFWMGCNRGIMRVRVQDLNDVADGVRRSFHTTMYGDQDGMHSPETNGGFQPSVIAETSGNLYFPTVAGVAVVSSRSVTQNAVIPPIVIEKLIIGNRETELSDGITLSYDSAGVEIHYASLSFTNRSKVRFKYKIEGVDNDWVDVGGRSRAYYTNIPPGEWTFRVIGSNNDGVWNETGAVMNITVTPPFWQTWWFYSFVGLFFAAVGPSIYYVRVTQLQRERRRQQIFAEQLIDSQEKERRRIAMELHDGLAQQILIIKNRAELALKEVGDPEKTAEQLREIAGSAVHSINDVRQISHDLRPVHLEQFGLTETIKHLREQLSESSAIEWAFHVDDIDAAVPMEKQINCFRILQEGTNNILRHSEATQASVMIRREENHVIVSMWDNGKGFDPAGPTPDAGLGLAGILERTYTLGGTCEIKSAPGKGTTIKILIPVQRHA